MSTTIQISKEVKQRLFRFINQIEKKLSKRISYNEAIKYLLDAQEKKMDKKDLIKHLEKFRGILNLGEGKKYLKELREIERERDRRFNSY
ncbi:MAG: hypothetical protein ACTSRI_19790 [Promethearchaeota archaeon]